jgi:hypothetical protein
MSLAKFTVKARIAMQRATKIISGVAYDFSHLESIFVLVKPKAVGAPAFSVLFSFGCHTFTKIWKDHYDPELLIVESNEKRCFCHDRYAQSLFLPDLIRKAVNGRAYFTERRNYLFLENVPGLSSPYAIFFNLQKSPSRKIDVTAFIVSAHERSGLPAPSRLSAITFATLISKTIRGEKIVRPKK